MARRSVPVAQQAERALTPGEALVLPAVTAALKSPFNKKSCCVNQDSRRKAKETKVLFKYKELSKFLLAD